MIRNAEHGVLTHYDPDGYYCEMMGRSGAAAEHTRPVRRILDELNLDTLRARARDAERELYNLGITFTVYSDSDAVDRILPFDVIPRILSRSDWRLLKDGVTQRVTALNLFLHDVYHEQKILKDGVVPAELILANKQFMSAACGIDPPHGTYVNVCGIDIVRDEKGRFFVLECLTSAPLGQIEIIA